MLNKGLDKTEQDLVLVGSSVDFNDDMYSHDIGYKISEKTFITEAFLKEILQVTVDLHLLFLHLCFVHMC